MCVAPLLPGMPRPGPPLTQRLASCLAEMSGTAADISLVHWRQQWLENGTLYFHVSMSSSGQLAQATAPTLREPSEIVEEQMHILHISVMVSEREPRRGLQGVGGAVMGRARWRDHGRRQGIASRWGEGAG